ncbi:MAG TPA: ATP-binding protein [Candidatus Saccharimonadales bacterium]|nr:ATP-binding protein [Candidatus Saccharimonadales bacterium]
MAGPEPEGWQTLKWDYPEVRMRMVACEISAADMAGVLTAVGGTLSLLNGETSVVPPLQDSTNWTRRASLVSWDRPQLRWPYRGYDVHAPSQPIHQLPQAMVVGIDAPPFPTFANAFAAFFYGDFSTRAPTSQPSQLARIRIESPVGRIRRVRVRPTRVEVLVDGTEVEGAHMQIVSPGFRAMKTVGKTHKVTLTVPDGLPDGAWVWLSRPSQWIDYRSVGGSVSYGHNPDLEGVEFDVPFDAATDLQSLISQGEGLELEFKVKLPDTDHEKWSTFKDVVAFANTQGGKVIFGVDNDGTVVGIADADKQATRDRLDQMIRAMVDPWPEHHMEPHQLEGRGILVLTVEAGGGAIFGVTVPPKEPAKFYVRRGGTSMPAKAEELRSSVMRGVPDTTAPHLLGLFRP